MAKSYLKVRKGFKVVFIVFTVIVVLSYLLVCLSAYIQHWAIGFLALSFPYLVVCMLLLIFFWFMAKPKIAFIPLITLLLGYKQITNFFATSFNTTSISKQKQATDIRIISWNIEGFNGVSKNKESKKLARQEVANSILKLNPDIICLQEFNTSTTGTDNIGLFTPTHPYFYFSKDYESKKRGFLAGSIIFSKYPILQSNKIKFPIAEGLIFVDVLRNLDTIRIFTTHLQSYKFKKEDYTAIDNISNTTDANLNASKNILKKLKTAFTLRAKQANIVKKELDKSPYSTIITGDFNDVPNSYTYAHIKGNKQDAFLSKSFGIGKTFATIAPTLRIDYILPDNTFTIKQFDLVDESLSDHFMLIADITLNKK